MRATLVEQLLAQQREASPARRSSAGGSPGSASGDRLSGALGHDRREVAGELARARARARRARSRRRARAAARGSRAARPPPRARAAPAGACRGARSGAPRNTSGATVSSSAAALRCSSTKRWMRSRASGGTCGDSVAAARPTTRSSLRRRATWITRARSTWRSSIGGRASARTTAAASCGSTSRRIQASTSRTSGRLRKRPRPSALARRALAAARAAILERAHSPRIRGSGRGRTGLRSVSGRDRLGRGAEDRRADRRARRRSAACGPRASSRWRTTSRAA